MKTIALLIKIMLFISLMFSAGCSVIKSPIIEPVVLEGSEQDEVLAYAGEPAENLLSGLIARNYAQFSEDFSSNMSQGMNEQAFNDLLTMLDAKLGSFQSAELVTVLKEETYSTLVYRLTFEKDNEVSMRVVFDLTEPHQISGLWFDSPVLRGN